MSVYRVLTIAFLQLYFVEEISGVIGVTLAVFSGINDPHWVMEPTTEIGNLYAKAQNKGLLLQVDNIPPRLGYKGFIVQEDRNESLVLGPKTIALQLKLFMSIPKGLIPNKVSQRVFNTITAGTVLPVKAKGRRKRYAPAFYEDPWRGQYKKKNNCYNYANLKITNTFAQPGRGSGAIYAAITKARIQAAAIRDGLAIAPNGSTPVGPQHVVALVVEDSVDFHWYLKDSDGKWSHKPGKTSVNRRDNLGRLIDDPRACDMNGYEFVCFMTTNKNTVQIN